MWRRALLEASKRQIEDCKSFYGIDVDDEVISNLAKRADDQTSHIFMDTILPQNAKNKTADFWKEKLPNISAVIANPPWSSEKIYDRQEMAATGFNLFEGQYDSYVLFLELAYEIVDDGGYFGFIIPDSLFDSQNEQLRRFLAQKLKFE